MNRNSSLAVVLALCAGTSAFSQNVGVGTASPASKGTVNGNASVGNGYIGTAAPANGLIVEGSVGIGTAAPSATARLHVALGASTSDGVLVTGTFSGASTVPNLGAGSRLMFYPGTSAFRAGTVTATQWDDASVGIYSVATGFNTTASGSSGSTAMGNTTTASGSASTAMGSSTMASGTNSTAMGVSTTASGTASTAMGGGTTASGSASTAMGLGTTASGLNSTAMSNGTTASGNSSTAMGLITTASGFTSTAMGNGTTASGDNSTAMGFETDAGAYADVAIGRYNVGGGTAAAWVTTDPVFEIGIGTSVAARANAMTVLKNGNVGIGTTNPGAVLEIDPAPFTAASQSRTALRLDAVSFGSFTSNALNMEFGNSGTAVIGAEVPSAGGRYDLVFSNFSISTTFTEKMGITGAGNVGIGTTAPSHQLQLSLDDAAKPTSSAWTIASDVRLKNNVHNYTEGLASIERIRPVWFTYTGEAGMPIDTGVGVLAQELQEIAPYMVGTWEYRDAEGNKTEYLDVNNGAMTYMLINAVKELSEQNKTLSEQNQALQEQATTQQAQINQLLESIGIEVKGN